MQFSRVNIGRRKQIISNELINPAIDVLIKYAEAFRGDGCRASFTTKPGQVELPLIFPPPAYRSHYVF